MGDAIPIRELLEAAKRLIRSDWLEVNKWR